MTNDTVSIPDVECIRDTGKALLCRINGRDVWVPQSVIHDDSEVYGLGHEGKLVIAGWFAEKEKLT